jgi:RNA polymerase sigma-70 factor (ECF subfamily)
LQLIRQCYDGSRSKDVTVNEQTWQVEQFERHRPHLRAVAYRMLGSLSDADDALQEAWLRLSRSDTEMVANLGGWLTTVVGRVCLDILRARRARHEDYVGSWLPEPIVSLGTETDPEQEAMLADSVGLALLVVLETLTPAERLSFVLHDMFAVPFDEIAPIVGRTPEAARQLASRGRRRVQGAAPDPDSDLTQQRQLVSAFLAAARAGDFEALLAVLDPDVVFRADRGKVSPLARPPITGAADVATQLLARGSRFAPQARMALVNGTAGLIVGPPHRPLAVAGFTLAHGRIAAIDLITDADKLRGLALD